MSCSCNNQPKHCNCATKNKGCPYKDISTDCLLYTGDTLECSRIETKTPVTEVIKKLDEFICEKVESITNHITLRNIGGGTEIYKGTNLLGEKNISTLKSNSLSIETNTDGSIQLENPPFFNEDGIPRFIVNNLYQGNEELGTISKPFKTIDSALETFVGEGDYNLPENSGGIIIIQKGNIYNFTGNFTYRNLNIVIEEGVIINHNPPTNTWLIDYDLLDNTSSTGTLYLSKNSILRLNQNGIRIKGLPNTVSGSKFLSVSGDGGTIIQQGNYSNGKTVIESNFNNDLNFTNNSTSPLISINDVEIISTNNQLWKIGGTSFIIFNKVNLRSTYSTSTIPSNLEACIQKGGSIVVNNSLFIFEKNRDKGFSFYSDSSFTPFLRMVNCELQVTANNLFYNDDGYTSNSSGVLDVYYTSSRFSTVDQIFDSGKKWIDVNFRYNIFENGKINDSKIDLTKNNVISVSNNIGNTLVFSTVRYANKSAAMTAGLTVGSVFINTTTNTIDIIT